MHYPEYMSCVGGCHDVYVPRNEVDAAHSDREDEEVEGLLFANVGREDVTVGAHEPGNGGVVSHSARDALAGLVGTGTGVANSVIAPRKPLIGSLYWTRKRVISVQHSTSSSEGRRAHRDLIDVDVDKIGDGGSDSTLSQGAVPVPAADDGTVDSGRRRLVASAALGLGERVGGTASPMVMARWRFGGEPGLKSCGRRDEEEPSEGVVDVCASDNTFACAICAARMGSRASSASCWEKKPPRLWSSTSWSSGDRPQGGGAATDNSAWDRMLGLGAGSAGKPSGVVRAAGMTPPLLYAGVVGLVMVSTSIGVDSDPWAADPPPFTIAGAAGASPPTTTGAAIGEGADGEGAAAPGVDSVVDVVVAIVGSVGACLLGACAAVAWRLGDLEADTLRKAASTTAAETGTENDIEVECTGFRDCATEASGTGDRKGDSPPVAGTIPTMGVELSTGAVSCSGMATREAEPVGGAARGGRQGAARSTRASQDELHDQPTRRRVHR
ncbi:hypothetical protein B0H12DRAFT_1079648 [Mycena haematopus]|nr:hypothetical protein B0H12DRAFT_1079648 [Mycena haematopus]